MARWQRWPRARSGDGPAATTTGRGEPTRSRRARSLRLVRRAAFYAVLLAIAVVDLFPLVWVVASSFKTQMEIFRWPPTFLPDRAILENYREALALLPAGRDAISDIPDGLRNSLLIAVSSTLLMLVVGAPAGYAFARLRFPGRRYLLIGLMSLRMLPPIVLAVPLFILATRTGTYDTKLIMVLVYGAFNLPFAVWLLSVFFQEMPREIEDAALVDGCTRFSVFYRMYLPLSLPALGTIAVLGFLAAWNEFLFAITLTSTTASKTTPVALASMQAAFQTRWAVMTAGAVLQCIPALLIVVFAQRYIVRGLTFGAVKG